MELAVLDKTIPLLDYPEKDLDVILETEFKYWLSNLLSIKAEKEEQMDEAIKVIKKKFWSLGLHEVKKAFEMYALGELDIEPKSNYIDIILVGQIFNAYKKESKTKPKPFNESEYKAEQDYIHVVSVFDHYISTGNIGEESVWIYTYLEETKKIVKFDQDIKKEIYDKIYEKHPKKEAITKSKIELLKLFFDEFKEKGTHIKDMLK